MPAKYVTASSITVVPKSSSKAGEMTLTVIGESRMLLAMRATEAAFSALY